MMKRIATALCTAALLAAPALAGTVDADQLAQLKQAERRIAARLGGSGKPSQSITLQQQRTQLQRMIAKLEAGEPVSADEMQRALQNTH